MQEMLLAIWHQDFEQLLALEAVGLLIGTLLARHGFLALFSSRFLPFVRVLTPMLMGMGRLPPLRMAIVSFGSAFLWCLLLSLVGKGMVSIPLFMRHQQQITQLLLMSSVLLFLVAVVTLEVRFARSGAQRRRL
jgi:membrane protein DedA with SNARE-associated domain